jgi:hypothetical protein
MPNHRTRATSAVTTAAATAGRSAHGTPGPRRQAQAGQTTRPASPITAVTMCGTG